MNPIVDVLEIRTDEDDIVKDIFSFLVRRKDGTNEELFFTLEGGRLMRDSFDAVPEIDRKKY